MPPAFYIVARQAYALRVSLPLAGFLRVISSVALILAIKAGLEEAVLGTLNAGVLWMVVTPRLGRPGGQKVASRFGAELSFRSHIIFISASQSTSIPASSHHLIVNETVASPGTVYCSNMT